MEEVQIILVVAAIIIAILVALVVWFAVLSRALSSENKMLEQKQREDNEKIKQFQDENKTLEGALRRVIILLGDASLKEYEQQIKHEIGEAAVEQREVPISMCLATHIGAYWKAQKDEAERKKHPLYGHHIEE